MGLLPSSASSGLLSPLSDSQCKQITVLFPKMYLPWSSYAHALYFTEIAIHSSEAGCILMLPSRKARQVIVTRCRPPFVYGRYCSVSNGDGQMAWIEKGGRSMQRVLQWRGGGCGPLADQVPSLDWTS